MNRTRKALAFSAIALVALALVACGDGSMTPSDAQGVTLRGSVQGASAGAGTVGATGERGRLAAEVVTVTVEGSTPLITTTVGPDGTFVLRGLPAGSFTLVFTSSTRGNLGSLTFDAVQPNHELIITVDVSAGAVVLLEE